MSAGGAGSVAAGVSEPAWRAFTEHVAEALDVGPGTRMFEVGCRAGAFLFPFHENAYIVGGLDESTECVRQARQAMPGGRFAVGQPSALDPAEAWDVVLACGAFSRFPNLDFARGVLARMAAKATHAIAILDLPDIDLEPADRDQLVFDRKWIVRTLAEIGATAVEIQDEKIEGYQNAPFRFNVFARL